VWFFPVFVALWLAICGALSFIGGWYDLAGRFKSDAPVQGEPFRFRSAVIGWSAFPVSYRSCLFGTVGSRSLALSASFPFAVMHPRLVIPWSAVERCERTRSVLMKGVAVYIAGFNRRLLFRGNLGDRVLDVWTRSRQAS
jgi:hypothetical protein